MRMMILALFMIVSGINSAWSQNNEQQFPQVGSWTAGVKTKIVSKGDTFFWSDGAILHAGRYNKGKLEYVNSVAVGSQINDLLIVNNKLFVATSHNDIQVYNADSALVWQTSLGNSNYNDSFLELEYSKDNSTFLAVKVNNDSNALSAMAWGDSGENLKYNTS